MKLISLYRKYSFIEYQNQLLSMAALITFLTYLISAIIPLVWIFKLNDNCFIQNNELNVFQQPMVTFQFKYIVLVEHTMTDKITLCSTFARLNNLEGTKHCGRVTSMEKDSNFDGIPDEIEFTINFHSMYKSGAKSFTFIAFLDARLRQCRLRIPSVLIVNKKEFPNNLVDRKIVISGSLQPEQDQPLVCPFFLRSAKSHFFFDKLSDNETSLDEFKITRITENLQRNPLHFYFRESSTVHQEVDNHQTSIKIRLKIPQTGVRFKKTFWQNLNELWINFVALFAVTFLLCKFILSNLFEHRWLMAKKKLIQ